MTWPRLLLVLGTALVLGAAPARAQDPADDQPRRPRIGLCLAGGGARGGAHVGVLKVLEELRIPIDCIAGTSIGSIVGGLYASGYAPAELDSAIIGIEWDSVFRDTPPRQRLEFRRKQEDLLPYFGFEFGVKDGGVRLASGLISGQKLNFLLRRLLMHTTGIDDFDDLPIPYRAVAADLVDGSLVVLGEGTLADALRASMAIPGAFTPHQIDGRVLIDGGMVRNLPYDVVKAMGADVVIAVDVGTPVGELSDDPTFLGVIFRALDLATKVNVADSRAQFTDQDLLLVPDLGPVTSASFPLMAEAVARGEAVARANLDRLREFSVPAAEYAAWRARHRAGRRGPDLRVGSIRVADSGRVDPRRIAPRLRTSPGAPLDLAVLEEDLTRVYRLGEFQSVDFRLEPTATAGTVDLVFSGRTKEWGPNYLRFGLALADHFDGDATYNLLFYHRRAELNARGGEWRNQLALGNRFVVDTELYQPLTFGGLVFVAPSFRLSQDKYKAFIANGRAVNADRDRATGRLDLGLAFSIWGEARLGLYRGRADGGTDDAALDYAYDDQEGGWRAALVFDRLDNTDFPRHGWAARAEAALSRPDLGADLHYDRAAVAAVGAASAGRATVITRLEGGTSFGSVLPQYDRFELGGFTQMSGLEPGQLQGDEFALAVVGTYLRIARIGPPLGLNVYAGALGEVAQAWLADRSEAVEGHRAGFSAFLGAETLLGPVYLGYGWTDSGDESLYFYLGKVF